MKEEVLEGVIKEKFVKVMIVEYLLFEELDFDDNGDF